MVTRRTTCYIMRFCILRDTRTYYINVLRVFSRDTQQAASLHSSKQLVFVVKTAYVLSKVKIKFALEQTMKAQRGSRGIVLLFL